MPKLGDWNDVKDKEPVKLTDTKRSWYELPIKEPEYKYGLNFELSDWKTDGLIFLAFVLLIPFLTAIIAYGAFSEVNPDTLQLIVGLVNFFSALIGFIITFNRQREKFWEEGLIFGYLFIMLPYLGVIIGSVLLASLNETNKDQLKIISSFLGIGVQIIAEIVIIILFFTKSDNVSGMFISTFKKSKILLCIVVPIGAIALFLISQLLFGEAYEKIFNISQDSKNQNDLIGLLKSDNLGVKYSYAILLFISSILVAPLCEELCTRYSFFSNVGNKWISLATSSLYFGFIHCGQSGDFVHLPTYIAAGFTLSSIFVVVRGNYNYTWLVHLISNLVSLIMILATTL